MTTTYWSTGVAPPRGSAHGAIVTLVAGFFGPRQLTTTPATRVVDED
jgi:hypothetical protein